MKTVESYSEMPKLLNWVDKEAREGIAKGLKVTIDVGTNKVTKSQFDAMHVWIRMCVKYLNDINMHRLSPITGKLIPWTESAFREDVYKVILKIWKGKTSTKDQSTADPNDIVLVISAHLATGYKTNITLPEWPSGR